MKTALLYLSFLVPYFTLLAQDGAIDPSFNPSGMGLFFTNTTYPEEYLKTCFIQPDNKIFCVARSQVYNGTFIATGNPYGTTLIRLEENGALDNTFNLGVGGFYETITYPASTINALLQQDGKIIVYGNFTLLNGITKKRIVRLNSNGTVDASFSTGIGFNAKVNSCIIQQDGKIIVGGDFTSYNGISINNGICRLNSDGTMDYSFNPTGFTAWNILMTGLQTNGKIIISGDGISTNLPSDPKIIRLNSNGSLDNTFNVQNSSSTDLFKILPNDKILIKSLNFYHPPLYQVNQNGVLDLNFNYFIEPGVTQTINDFTFQADGRILVVGPFTHEILVNGLFYGENYKGILRILPNGQLDESFRDQPNTTVGTDYTIYKVNYLQNNKILITGNFRGYGGYTYNNLPNTVNGVARLTTCSSYSIQTEETCEPYFWEGQLRDTSGTYSSFYTGLNGCDSVSYLTLTVNPPITDLFYTISGSTITASNTNATYQWLDCNNNYAVIPGAINQSFTPSSNGSYAVQLTENGCSDTTLCVQISNLGLNVNYSTLFTIHPNPATNQVIISSQFFTENEAVQIFNTAGQLVLEYPNLAPQHQTYTINVEQLNPGIYFIQIGEMTQKLIIE